MKLNRGGRASPIVLGHPIDRVRIAEGSQKSLPCARRVLARPSRAPPGRVLFGLGFRGRCPRLRWFRLSGDVVRLPMAGLMHEELKREARPYRPPTFHHVHTQAWRPGLRKNRPFGPNELPGSWRGWTCVETMNLGVLCPHNFLTFQTGGFAFPRRSSAKHTHESK